MLLDKAEAIKPDMVAHKTLESWANEGAALAPRAGYLDSELLMQRGDGEGVLQTPPEYASACGQVARAMIGKAGTRLAEAIGNLLK